MPTSSEMIHDIERSNLPVREKSKLLSMWEGVKSHRYVKGAQKHGRAGGEAFRSGSESAVTG